MLSGIHPSSHHPLHAHKASNEKKTCDFAEQALVDADEKYADICKNIDWLPFDEWLREQCQRVPGTIETDATQDWKQMQINTPTEFRISERIINFRVYRGFRQKEGHRTATQSNEKRTEQLTSKSDVENVQEEAAKAMAAFKNKSENRCGQYCGQECKSSWSNS